MGALPGLYVHSCLRYFFAFLMSSSPSFADLKADPLSVVMIPRSVPQLNPYTMTNLHTGKKRLDVFVMLSQQKQLPPLS